MKRVPLRARKGAYGPGLGEEKEYRREPRQGAAAQGITLGGEEG